MPMPGKMPHGETNEDVLMTVQSERSRQTESREDKPLPSLLDEFRTALREEIEAAREAASASAIELANGRRIGERGGGFQYVFSVDSVLNIPDDSPADLRIAGQSRPIEATIVSVEGLTVTISVPVDIGEFVARARLQSDMTHLLRLLITRIEDLATQENPAGDRLLGLAPPAGEAVPFEGDPLYKEQCDAVGSGIGRDTTFVWGPPGTGKTLTIGALATELHRLGRSVLVVSHTNAAVDQALIQVANEMTSEDLANGLVLRLGEPKDQRITEWPDVLAQTHIERRSAELVVERDALMTDKAVLLDQIEALDRLLAIAAFLENAAERLAEWSDTVDRYESSVKKREALAERIASLERDLEPLALIEQPAVQALADAARAVELGDAIPRLRDDLYRLREKVGETKVKRLAAEELHEEARTRVPKVRAARKRLEVLRRELPRREPLLAATDEELAELQRSVLEAEGILSRSEQSNLFTRRLRGLPNPMDQRQLLESLVARAERLGNARADTARAIEGLQDEFRDAQATIDSFGHLPDPKLQGEKAQLLREQEISENRSVAAKANDLASAERELDVLPEHPVVEFRDLHGVEASTVVESIHKLQNDLAPFQDEVRELDSKIRDLTYSLESGLQREADHLNALGLIERVDDTFTAMLVQVEAAREEAESLISDRQTDEMKRERDELQRRVREVDSRLQDIDQALQEIEHLVIAEARVVATTLTRAYKRESIQARRFDTVILDEASMAPIPALWAVAARAARNVVVVGDFRQLPPIKHSTHELAEKWLGRDIFEVAGVKEAFTAGREPPHCVALMEQHRMHPAISAIANRFVYSGRLRDGQMVASDASLDGWFDGRSPFDQAVLLVDTSGLNAWVTSVRNAGRTSRLNFLSATVCVDVADLLLRSDRAEFRLGNDPRIFLAAPYRPHASLMSTLVKSQFPGGEVVAGTAHTFQGNEAPVVIFDFVNDEPHWRVGMFGKQMEPDTKRLMNVALTRAQRRLILVGDFKWIESKATKGGFLRQLIAYLREHYQVIDAKELIPEGFASRAAASQTMSSAERGHAIEPQLVVSQDRFYEHLRGDLAGAINRVVIYSPFMTTDRVGNLEPHLRAVIERGAEVWVVTKPTEERGRDAARYAEIESALHSWGVNVVHKRGMHEKLVIVDDQILWQGSLNPLSFSATQEIMERRHSKEIVADYQRVLRLEDLLGPYVAEETVCPYCESEIVAAEGGGEPFYWRCVADNCFTRSIGDPMPIDGRVVCRRDGGALEFRWPNENPFWRCVVDHHHRQPLARSHIRLPKMREIIPKDELRALDRRKINDPKGRAGR